MSVMLDWQPVSSTGFEYSGGDDYGTVARNLEKVFGDNYPMTLTYDEHFEAVNVMARLQCVDDSIYHQICNVLQVHKAIILDTSH